MNERIYKFLKWNPFMINFRRKPQNLTPPLSSDGGSSASGQSPGSTHNGSPPPAVKRPSSTFSNLNNSVDKYTEPTNKKARISRVKNIDHSSISSMRSSYEHPHRNDYLSRARDDDYYGSVIRAKLKFEIVARLKATRFL